MKRNYRSFKISLVVLAALAGCSGEEPEERALPSLVRERLAVEMKTILRDVKLAEEQAAALEGRYLELDALRTGYLNREIPAGYRLSVTGASADGFRAEITHAASGLSCQLVVGPGAGARPGVPVCAPPS